MDRKTEKELLKKAKAGHIPSYEDLMADCRNKIYQSLCALLINNTDAEEVLHDACIKAWQQLPRFRGDSRFSTWLHKIARNEALMRLRSSKNRLKHESTQEELPVEKMGETRSAFDALRQYDRKLYLKKAMIRLKKDERMALSLFYFEEQSIREIEEATGWSNSNIKILLYRGRNNLYRELRTLLKNEVEDLL
jgi:RNA polymerase sigma factor (sigma-70 family)